MKKENKFKSIQNISLTLNVVIFMLLLAVVQGVKAQNGQYVLDDVGGGSVAIGGSSSAQNRFASPFIPSRKGTRVQYLYEASELGLSLANSSGYTTITSIAFHVSNLSNFVTLPSYELQNMTISMGHTVATYDGVGSTHVWGIKMPPAGECTWDGSSTPEYLQQVKNSFDLTISQTGWVELKLDTPFVWDGVRNVVVEVCKSDPRTTSASFPSSSWYAFDGVFHTNPSGSSTHTLTRSLYSSSNTGSNHTLGCEMEKGDLNVISAELTVQYRKHRPNIRFTFECLGGSSLLAGQIVKLNSGNDCQGGDVLLGVVNDERSSNLSYQWYMSTSDDINMFFPISGETLPTLTVQRAEIDLWYLRYLGCGEMPDITSRSDIYKVKGVNTWDGTFWSFGSEPGTDEPVRINNDYDTAVDGSGVLQACTLYIDSGTFIVRNGDVISLTDKLVVHEEATVVFENNTSLIQKNDSAVNEGKISYKRDSQPVRLLDYTYWSSPVTGMTPNQFSSGTPANRIYHWNHLTTGASPQSWVGGVANSPMISGKGYIIRAPNGYPSAGAGTVFQGSFVGVPNNGIITVAAQGGPGNWNLIGNPYPAAIDADAFLMANSAVLDGTLRFWTHNTLPGAIPSYPGFSSQALNYSSDDYATYNLSGSIGFPAENNGNNMATPGRFIGAGQSFMVEGGTTSGNVVFTNDMRKIKTGYDNSQFFRFNPENLSQTEEKHRIWLEVIHQDGKFKQTMVGYIDGATDNLDWGYDSKLMPSGDIQFYSLAENNKLVIQGKANPFNTNDSVALGLTTTLSGEFIINMYQFDGLFENQNVYLLDNYTNTFHNIKDGAYVFTGTAGTFDDRFELRFTEEVLSLNPHLNTENTVLCFAQDAEITVKSNDFQINEITVYDSAGRLLFEQNKVNVLTINVTGLLKTNQLLLVKVATEDGTKSIHKIIF